MAEKPKGPSTQRIILWVVVAAFALWMIGSGIVQVIQQR